MTDEATMHPYRTHNCGELRTGHVGATVRLSGWVHRKRDHGQLLFIDLRDHYGITQIVFQPEHPFFADAENGAPGERAHRDGPRGRAQPRYGQSEPADRRGRGGRRRPAGRGAADQLPLQVNAERDYPEDTRLRFRFLDLRREAMQRNILLRSRVISSIRRRMEAQGFVEFQTPILTASSPEGARDFLVPSRLHPGKFYALPQAPQQYKQLLMISGFDRYFQIAPCFRDEDARADRSPGRVLPARSRDGVRHPGGRVRRGRAGDARAVHRVHRLGGDAAAVPAHRLSRGDARSTAPTSPICATRSRSPTSATIFRGRSSAVFAKAVEGGGAWCARCRRPGAVGRQRALLRSDERLGPEPGAPGLGYIFWREGEEAAPGRSRRTSALSAPQRSARIEDAPPEASSRTATSRTSCCGQTGSRGERLAAADHDPHCPASARSSG